MSWYSEGIRFQCQGSGRCCVSRGEYGFVYLNLADRRRIAKLLKLKTAVFTKKYCGKSDGYYHLKESKLSPNCQFLEGSRCSIYKARPAQCRTWPFWPENLNAKVWKDEVASFCPGVGKGPLISSEEIEKTAQEQTRAELTT